MDICCSSTSRRGIPVLGIEPAANIAELAIKTKGIPTLVEFFDEQLAGRLAAEGKLADVIHAHNVFAHVPDPNRFAGGIKRLLKPDGVAVVEAPYVRDLIAKLEFDTIYHEHFSYYSVSAVEALCRRHGLVVCRCRAGADPRRFAAAVHRACGPAVSPHASSNCWQRKKSEGLLTFEHYRDFGDRVARLKEQLLALLQRLQGEGRRIAAYGASAKGSTLMNAFGIDARLIEFVVDRSSLKQGRFTPGNHLPILPPEALLERQAGLRSIADLELFRRDSRPAERVPCARRQVHCPGSRSDGEVSAQRCSIQAQQESPRRASYLGLRAMVPMLPSLSPSNGAVPSGTRRSGNPNTVKPARSRNGNGK